MKYTQNLTVGMVYLLKDYTAPKVYNGLYFECLYTDQTIPAHAAVRIEVQHFDQFDINEIHKPERFARLQINGLRLGEGCLTDAQFSHKFQWQLLPNRCYVSVFFFIFCAWAINH